MKHLNITVYGKVQGVFFRKYTEQKAIETGVKGFVKNNFDGSVYIEAEGDEELLAEFVEWCYDGPPSAVVKDVKIEEGEGKQFTNFQITK